MILLSHFKNLPHPPDTLQQKSKRFFIFSVSEQGIQLFSRIVGILVSSGSEVALAEQQIQLCVCFKISHLLRSDHIPRFNEEFHGLLDIFVGEVDLSDQKVVFPQRIALTTEHLPLHFKGILSILDGKVEVLRMFREI